MEDCKQECSSNMIQILYYCYVFVALE